MVDNTLSFQTKGNASKVYNANGQLVENLLLFQLKMQM